MLCLQVSDHNYLCVMILLFLFLLLLTFVVATSCLVEPPFSVSGLTRLTLHQRGRQEAGCAARLSLLLLGGVETSPVGLLLFISSGSSVPHAGAPLPPLSSSPLMLTKQSSLTKTPSIHRLVH